MPMTALTKRLGPLIDLTVQGLLEEQPDIDPALADKIRADLEKLVAVNAGLQQTYVRLVLESGWMAGNIDRLVGSYGWWVERHERANAIQDTVYHIDAENQFHVGVSERFPIEYCAFSGPDAAALCALVSTRISYLTVEDLVEAARGAVTEVEKCAIAWGLGAAATQSDPFIEQYIRRLLADGSRHERLAAIEAAALTGWTELAQDLDFVAAEDSVRDLRVAAAEGAWLLRGSPPTSGASGASGTA